MAGLAPLAVSESAATTSLQRPIPLLRAHLLHVCCMPAAPNRWQYFRSAIRALICLLSPVGVAAQVRFTFEGRGALEGRLLWLESAGQANVDRVRRSRCSAGPAKHGNRSAACDDVVIISQSWSLAR